MLALISEQPDYRLSKSKQPFSPIRLARQKIILLLTKFSKATKRNLADYFSEKVVVFPSLIAFQASSGNFFNFFIKGVNS